MQDVLTFVVPPKTGLQGSHVTWNSMDTFPMIRKD